jgi:hypothetical protein
VIFQGILLCWLEFDFHSLVFIEAWVLSVPCCVAAWAVSALLAPTCQPNFLL